MDFCRRWSWSLPAPSFYLNSGTGLRSATNTTTHTLEEFNGISYLGWDSNSSSRRFRGALDEVRVCKRALSAPEVQALYAAVITPATCTIASPGNGAVVTTANPTLLASVGSNGNTISKVEFLSGGTFLGAARSAPYTLVWSNLVSGGSYSVQARAWYGPANYSVTSSVVNFTVAIPIILHPDAAGWNADLAMVGCPAALPGADDDEPAVARLGERRRRDLQHQHDPPAQQRRGLLPRRRPVTTAFCRSDFGFGPSDFGFRFSDFTVVLPAPMRL